MARRIITEADIIEAAGAGKTSFVAPEGECIVTDQARDRALELGVTLICGEAAASPSQCCPAGGDGTSGPASGSRGSGAPTASAGTTAGTTAGVTPGAAGGGIPMGGAAANLAEQVVKALRARLPQGVDAAEAERLVRVVVAARMGGAPSGAEATEADHAHEAAGFAFVEASSVLKSLGRGGGPGEKALLAEALAATGQAKLSAGYLAWEKASFTRNVDEPEVCVVIEGELHLTVGGRTVIAKPGDLAYLPQGTRAVYSAPGRVVMACVNTRG
jgi:ethanolamine utilization protein EutQ